MIFFCKDFAKKNVSCFLNPRCDKIKYKNIVKIYMDLKKRKIKSILSHIFNIRFCLIIFIKQKLNKKNMGFAMHSTDFYMIKF